MTTRLKQLRDDKAKKLTRFREITDKAASESREYTEEEQKERAEIKAQLGTPEEPGPLQQAIHEEEWLAEEERQAPAASTLYDPNSRPEGGHASVHVGRDNAADAPWQSMGEFFAAVADAYSPGGHVDPRLLGKQANASGMGSVTGADGGFLVQTGFSTRLLEAAAEQSLLYPLCAKQPVGANEDGIEFPYVDETDRSGGTVMGGVRIYRRAEADTVDDSKAKIGSMEIRLEDMMGITYATRRLLRDTVALESFIRTGFGNAYAFKLDDEIVNGTGAGQCLGVLNSANNALISVSKEDGQAANTITWENVRNMRHRMLPRNRRRAVWLVNPEAESQLEGMYMPIGTGGVPVYMPAQGVAGDGFDRLYNRPVIPIEHAAALGSKGDIAFVDFGEYMVVEKGMAEIAESMHVRFIYGENTFRFMYQINGRPARRSALTLHKGSNSYSPYVTLAARS